MPENKIKAFMERIFTPRTIFLGSLVAITALLILKCQKFDRADQGEISQEEKYKKELMLARDSLKAEQAGLKRCEARNEDAKTLQDSILFLNEKLDEYTGKKKAVSGVAKTQRLKSKIR